MQTIIEYNGIRLVDVLTEGDIDFTPEKDSTGVDQIGVRVTGTFTAVLHTAANDRIGKKIATQNDKGLAANFGPALARTLQQLSKDRRRFTLKIGRVTMLDIIPLAVEPGVPPAVRPGSPLPKGMLGDIAHGPIPQVQVIKMISGVSASVRFRISALVPNCDGGGQNSRSGLINFRFAIFEDVDCTTWLTTRTFTGRIRVAHKNVHPHAVAREVAIPPLEDGFQRKIINWHESLDGLTLDFTIRDEEKVAAAPWNRFANVGATDWTGTMRMSSNSFGLTATSELEFHLTGPKGTSKADLIDLAFRVCQAKARLFDFAPGGDKSKQGFMEYFQLGETLHSNEVTCQCRIMHTGGATPGAGVGLLTVGNDRVLGQPISTHGLMKSIGYNPDRHFQPGTSAGVGTLFLSLLQTPCTPNSMPEQYSNPPKPPKNKRKARDQTFEIRPDLEYSQSTASPDQLDNMYFEYVLESRILTSSGRIALPTGSSKQSRGPSLAVVALHKPTAIREISIDASRINESPKLPTPDRSFADANGITYVMIGDAEISATAPQVSADNRKLLFRVGAQLRYAMSRPPKAGESLPIGCVPYRVSNLQDPSRVISGKAFVPPEALLR